jgi:plasmid stability protein
MPQITLRVDDDLARRLKIAASSAGRSVNAFAGSVLRAAVDPELAGDEAQRLRERLRAAGLLEEGIPLRAAAPDPAAVRAARRAAGGGTSLAQLVSEGRR